MMFNIVIIFNNNFTNLNKLPHYIYIHTQAHHRKKKER